MVRANPAGEPVVLLLKSRERQPGRVLAVINSTLEDQPVELTDLKAFLGKPMRAWQDLTPDTIPLKLKSEMAFTLAPARLRIFYNPKAAPLQEETKGA